jgi:uncharacterized protein YegP (UPF0339 family)
MGTAPKKSRAAKELARRAYAANVPASMEFLIVEDNGGAYHWRLRDSDGAMLAQSGAFASYRDAEHAAQQVRGGAVSARFPPRAVGAVPIDLIARRDAPSDNSDAPNDNSDAERWLDEGGSVSSQAVTKWPQPR